MVILIIYIYIYIRFNPIGQVFLTLNFFAVFLFQMENFRNFFNMLISKKNRKIKKKLNCKFEKIEKEIGKVCQCIEPQN